MPTTYKKVRLVYSESNNVNTTSINVNPKVSFDNGASWVNLGDKVSALRSGIKVPGSSITKGNNGYNQLEVVFTNTVYSVPKIIGHKLIANANGMVIDKPLHFMASCVMYDTPGFETRVTGDPDRYYTGDIKSASPVYTVPIPNNTSKYDVELLINYPDFINGLCIYAYSGTLSASSIFDLVKITNLTQKLKSDISFTTSTIDVANAVPLPSPGVVLIDSEYIYYTRAVPIPNNPGYTLQSCIRGYKNTEAKNHTKDSEVRLALYDGGKYGEIPIKTEYVPSGLDSSYRLYMNFDSKTLDNRIPNIKETDPKPISIGTIGYDFVNTNFSNSLVLTENGIVNTKFNSPLNTSGTIYISYSISSFNNTEFLKLDDPIIFGNRDGLWLRLSRNTMKPYFGYKAKTIISENDSRLISIMKNTYNDIMLTWENNYNENTKKYTNQVRFKLMINRFLVYNDIVPDIRYSTFTTGTVYLGGRSSGNDILDSAHCSYDNVIILNKSLSVSEYDELLKKLSKSFADFCGKVRIGGEEILSPLPSDINRYIPKFDLKISQIYNMGTVGTHLSNWILSKEYENKDQIYVANPANFNSLKLKFDFDIGDATLRGFETPSIKNIMLITSEGSIE